MGFNAAFKGLNTYSAFNGDPFNLIFRPKK